MNFAEKMPRTVSIRSSSKGAPAFVSFCCQSHKVPRLPQPTTERKVSSICWAAPWFLGIAATFSGGQTHAAAISATDVFLALEQAPVNDTAPSTPPVLFIGADDVVPNGFNGTTGVATSS